MQLSERLNFNMKLMDFCLHAINWSQKGDQDEYLNSFAGCVERTIIVEQIFRAEIVRPRPGLPVREPAGDE